MMIGGMSAESLAARFGTPLYVYDAAVVRARYRRLRAALGPSALVCYAVKANTNRAVCRLLAREGAGADVVSGGELLRALAAGFPADRVVFSGIGKTAPELALALRRGVLAVNVESAAELSALSRTAARLRLPAPVSVRLNPDVDAGTHPHVTTGRAENKFGVEEAEAEALLLRAARDRWLRPRGLQCHIGSQVRSAAPYRKAAASLARVARRLAAGGVRLDLLDMGGGLGVDYEGSGAFPVAAWASALRAALAGFPGARLLVEPGRYLVAESGTLLTRVLYRKKTSRRSFVVVDAAMNDLARPALYDAYHPIVPASRRRGKLELVDVVGPVCETGDFLARGRRLPPTAEGDLLAVGKVGAYGFSMSSQYNSRPRAAEVLVDGGRAKLARRRETLADLVRGEVG